MSKKDGAPIKHYSIFWHKLGFVAYLIVLFAVCALAFPWLLKLIYMLFSAIPCFAEVPTVEGDSNPYLSLLPDFLGGLCGILIAALLDSVIISRLVHLKKYEALVSILWDELKAIEEETAKIGTPDGAMPGDTLPTPILDSVIASHESMALIHNLPRCFWWEKKGPIAQEICDLETDITELNGWLSAMTRNTKSLSQDIIDANRKIMEAVHRSKRKEPEESDWIQYSVMVFFEKQCNNVNKEDFPDLRLPLKEVFQTEEIDMFEYYAMGVAEEKASIMDRIKKIRTAIGAKK